MESDQEDLISIGTIGLIKGITTFDASKGARLATYAARCVENAILTPAAFKREASAFPDRKKEGIGKIFKSLKNLTARRRKALKYTNLG